MLEKEKKTLVIWIKSCLLYFISFEKLKKNFKISWKTIESSEKNSKSMKNSIKIIKVTKHNLKNQS